VTYVGFRREHWVFQAATQLSLKKDVSMLFSILYEMIVAPSTSLERIVQIFDPMLTLSLSTVVCKRSQAMVAAPHRASREERLLIRNTEKEERGTPDIVAQ
jgi:hypothetical protein